jgi:RNA polymerase sigma factor (sigma-70 family)
MLTETPITTLAANTTRTIDFKEQLKELIPSLRKYAYTFTRNADDVADLVQDTLARAMDKQHLYQEENGFKSWVYTIMRNIFINSYRRRVKFPKWILKITSPAWRKRPGNIRPWPCSAPSLPSTCCP